MLDIVNEIIGQAWEPEMSTWRGLRGVSNGNYSYNATRSAAECSSGVARRECRSPATAADARLGVRHTRRGVSRLFVRRIRAVLASDKNSWSVRGGTSINNAIGSTFLRGRSLSCP
jgi:hypothetical protein